MIDEKEIALLIEQNEILKRQNDNLLRIMREKSNQDRGIKSKKTNSGYVLLFSKFKRNSANNGIAVKGFWQTKLQTPYKAEVFYETVKDAVNRDINCEDSFINKCGIMQNPILNYQSLTHEQRMEKNTLFDFECYANFKSGYWEVTISHTLPVMIG